MSCVLDEMYLRTCVAVVFNSKYLAIFGDTTTLRTLYVWHVVICHNKKKKTKAILLTFQPTSTRLSLLGMHIPVHGMLKGIGAVMGPMARDVDALAAACRVLFSGPSSREDPYRVAKPFQEEIFNDTKARTIGYYDDDGYFESTPSMKRALIIAKEQLETRGHRLGS